MIITNKRCIIITSYLETSIRASITISPDDFVICADGGIIHAIKEDVKPDIIIGDFDSSDFNEIQHFIENNADYSKAKLIRTSPEKDDTDTLMCVKHGIKHGCDEYVLVGGLGGRIDHTMANFQTLSYIVDEGNHGVIVDGKTKAILLQGPDEIQLFNTKDTYFSVFSFSEECTGVYERNVKYPLENKTLTQSFPLGTSNEFTDMPAEIAVKKGKLLILQTNY